MAITKLDDLLKIKNERKMKLAVVSAQDKEVLEAVVEAMRLGIIDPILIGNMEKIEDMLKKFGFNLEEFNIINEKDLGKAAEIGVKLVSRGEADFLMKGIVDTATLMKAVLNKEWGLRTESLLSHIMVYEIDTYPKLIYLTDGGMNLYPDLEQKIKIIENGVQVAKAMGNETVKVACLAAKEIKDPKMPATMDAYEITRKYQEGYFEDGIIIDGPVALDLAVSKKSANIKGYKSEVAGDADILLVPNIEMGNGIGKSITYFAGGKSAGIIMGAKVPVVLTSRADTHESKLYSIALGSIIAEKITN
ncbi:MAG: bifunctional enoyl-CoA hydratase/phosphate acetyltransferase [Tissierellia bacterium]|nr:bifunctional enoyl-CoA hydratase/phosphate acetyltransferase [Tissierellia bacterium]